MNQAAAVPDRLDWCDARLVLREAVTARATLFRFAVDWTRPHRAGQYVELRLRAPDGYEAKRFYSIASPPSQAGTVDLVIALADDGEVSGFFHDVVTAGDRVALRGPVSLPFSWAPEDGGPLLLLGGGSGVAPLLSMVRERGEVAPQVPAALVCAARTRPDVPYLDELEARARTEPHFGLVLALSREGSRRRIDRSAVGEALAMLREAPQRIFVCGSGGFVATASELLLDAGLPPDRIRTERFG